MNLKIYEVIISLILAFALITAAAIPTAFVNVLAQGEGGNGTHGQIGGNMTKGNETEKTEDQLEGVPEPV
jgi:hypothetical protein